MNNEKFSPNSQNVPEKRDSWFKRETKKVVGIAALSLMTLMPKQSQGQQKYTENDTMVRPVPTWNFEDSEKVQAYNKSIKYPGLIEHFIQNDNVDSQKVYLFRGYYVEDSNHELREAIPPDDLDVEIVKKKAEIAIVGDPHAWAEKQFEFQKTDSFKKQVMESVLEVHKQTLESAKYRLSNSSDTAEIQRSQKEISYEEGQINALTKNVENFVNEASLPIPALEEQAKGKINKLTQAMNDLQKEKEKVLKYIEDHTPKMDNK